MIELVLLPLVCFGICKIIIEGSIFQEFRDWIADKEVQCTKPFKKLLWFKFNQLINCYLCLGFHFGWMIGLFDGPFPWWNILYNGCFYAAIVWIIHSFVQFLGNGNDPNRSVIVQIPDSVKMERVDTSKININNNTKEENNEFI